MGGFKLPPLPPGAGVTTRHIIPLARREAAIAILREFVETYGFETQQEYEDCLGVVEELQRISLLSRLYDETDCILNCPEAGHLPTCHNYQPKENQG